MKKILLTTILGFGIAMNAMADNVGNNASNYEGIYGDTNKSHVSKTALAIQLRDSDFYKSSAPNGQRIDKPADYVLAQNFTTREINLMDAFILKDGFINAIKFTRKYDFMRVYVKILNYLRKGVDLEGIFYPKPELEVGFPKNMFLAAQYIVSKILPASFDKFNRLYLDRYADKNGLNKLVKPDLLKGDTVVSSDTILNDAHFNNRFKEINNNAQMSLDDKQKLCLTELNSLLNNGKITIDVYVKICDWISKNMSLKNN